MVEMIMQAVQMMLFSGTKNVSSFSMIDAEPEKYDIINLLQFMFKRGLQGETLCRSLLLSWKRLYMKIHIAWLFAGLPSHLFTV